MPHVIPNCRVKNEMRREEGRGMERGEGRGREEGRREDRMKGGWDEGRKTEGEKEMIR